ncbi:putative beta-amylase [Dorcoceras hygrometricum]|uniref:Putative beta-amylase n=1 Tax=Dorcoceras hygrometricum TaxID=472368 RepID=A0A2Z7A8F7_9LAMI|nr:putative beta-amylase [Dorcoceras hygrometricum]
MQGIKATTESWEPKDLNNSSTARSDQRKDSQWPQGILSTWELPTHLQYTVPDANNQLHLLFPSNEMWELPTPLIAANKPSREMRYGSYPLSLRGTWELPGRPRTQHPASRKCPKSGTKRSVSALGVQRYHSRSRRSCLPSAIEEDKRSLKPNDVAESYCRYWTRHPQLTAEQLSNICSQCNNRSLTQLKLTQLTVESSSLIQNAAVPTNPNDDIQAPATESTLSHH